jgi:predicted nucleotidyltransferase/predicted transcriptional regulator with HTH domain
MDLRRLEVLQALFSSRVRVKLLTHLFSHPSEQFYARSLSRELGEHYNAVWHELNNLERLGLLVSEQNGNVKHYRLNPDFPIYEELKRIILKTSGLGQALREALRDLGTVEWAFIYGSVAAGEEDVLSDLDLMLVGELDLLALAEAIAHLEERLRREINYLVLTRAELAQRLESGDPLTGNILSGPKIMLIGDEGPLRQVARGATS